MGTDKSKNPAYQVVGVVEDFRIGRLSTGDAPLAILYDEGENPAEPLMAKVAEGRRKEAIQFLKELYNEVMNEGESNYSFVKDEIEKLYDDDRKTACIYVILAGLTICAPCLGLSGLSLYDICQRYREIALRRMSGTTGKQITLLLVRKYLSTLGTTFIVAIPSIYYIINDCTEDFAIKALIGTGIPVTGFILALLISPGILLQQVHKAIRINPTLVIKDR